MTIKLTKDQKIQIYKPRDVFEVMREILMKDEKFDRDKEHFWIVGLLNNNVISYIELVTLGLLNKTLVAPREVFRTAVQKGIARAILCHNHTSGSTEASEEDIDVTKWLVQAGLIVGITVEDHVIITPKSFASLRESGQWSDIVNDAKYKPHYLIEYERTVAMAKELKAQNVDVYIIARASGLSIEEIENL